MSKRLASLFLLTAGAALAFPNPDGTCSITTAAVLPQAVQGASITYTFATAGCATPLTTFAIATGQLPSGLTLKTTASGATLSGKPTSAGVYAFALRAIDASYKIPSKSFVIRVNSPLQIDTPAAATGTNGSAYTDTIRARGGVAPYTFSVVEGALPAGLTLAPATGVISGTMPAAGTRFRIRATDSSSVPNTAERPYTIAPGGQITTLTTPPVGVIGGSYSFDIDGSLGAGGFALGIGPLPPGLSIDTNGLIGGTPSAPGEFHFTVRQTVGTASIWRSYRILVRGTGSISGTPRDAEETFAYNHVFDSTGSVGPYTYSVTVGALPAGITLDAGTGALLGELPNGGLGTSFTVTATDATGASFSQPFSITRVLRLQGAAVSPPVVRMNQGASNVAMYSLTQGGSGKTFSRIGGHLASVDSSTGAVSYFYSTPGVFVPVVLGTDALGGAVILNTGSLNVVGNLAISTAAELPNTPSSTAYSATVNVVNGIFTPLTFSVSSGAMPMGLTLNAATGAITGSAAGMEGAYGEFFTITVTDSASQTASRDYFIGVGAGGVITTTAVPAGTTGSPYNLTFTQSGAVGPVWVTTPADLPPGLTMSAAGVLSGTPTTAGTYTFEVQLTEAEVFTYNRKEFTIYVSAPLSASIAPPASLATYVGSIVGATVSPVGGRSPMTLSIPAGTLPEGLYFNQSSPLGISGIPVQPGSASFNILVTDADGRTATIPYSILIRSRPVIINAVPPPATRNVPYNYALSSEGGLGPYNYSYYGVLPAGLTFSAAGVFSGTPTEIGSFDIFIFMNDSAGSGNTGTVSLSITDAVVITNAVPLPNGLALSSYSTPVTTTGGTTSKTFSISAGDLPPLITIHPVTGAISNLPLIPGTYTFTLRAEDSEGRVGTLAEQLTIGGGVTISPATVPNGSLNTPYSVQLTAPGAVGSVAWSVPTGTLPAGVALNAGTGLLSGTPTAAGSYTFTVQAVDQTAAVATANYTMQVLGPLTVAPASLPNANVGTAYSQTLTATGASGAVTWAVTGGALPAGLALGAGTGVISGTPTTPGPSSFTIQATDSLTQVGSRDYAITVLTTLAISPAALANGTVGAVYNQTLTATNATGAVTWTLASGTLPAGLTLGSSTGNISGTPTAPGTASFTIQATDSLAQTGSRPYSITVLSVLGISPATLPNGSVGSVYNQTLTATNATGAVTWTLASGTLPAGLTLGSSTGIISGTATAPGTSSFTVQATDSLTQTGSRAYSITVLNTLAISPATLPNGAVGSVYSQTPTASNATGAVTWTIASGTLPAGLTLGSATGNISGTPTAPGTSSFTIQATDSLTQTGSRAYSITVLNVLGISPATLPNGTDGSPYSQTLTATGASGAVTWAVASGTLPAGLTLAASSGVISGTPTTPGTSSFTIQATDSLTQTGSQAYSLTILNILGITPATLPSGTIGTAYSQTLTATGETGAVTWAVATGTLPPGLTLGASSGVISGTPSTSGTFAFTVQATDSLTQSGTRTYSITVSSILNITPATVANGTVGVAYNQTLTVSNGTGAVSWLVTAGALPPGLSLGAGTGVIGGTPSAAGTFSFTIQATDSLAQTGTRAYTPTIAGVLTIAPATVPGGSVGVAYSQTLTATGGTGAVTWAINTGTLPPGLTLTATTGAIAGSPSAAGTYPFTILATDSIGQTGAKAYSIAVAEELTITPATLPDGAVGVAYNQTLTAAPAAGQVTWATSAGALPDGLTLGATAGIITGTPTAVGTFSFTVVATDSTGPTGSHAYSITVGGTVTITPATIPNGAVGAPYSQTLNAAIIGGAPVTGGTAWSVSAGALPPGLSLGAVNGQISGTPATTGSYAFTVAATLQSQTGSRAYTMDVVAGLAIAPLTLPDGEVGAPYNQTLTVSGAFSPVTFSVSNGNLPAGLTLSTGGLISGTPSVPGSAVFTVLAQNTQGQTAQRTYTLAISLPLAIAPATLPDGSLGAGYSQTLSVTGATQPFTWTIASGTLPPGLTLATATGVLGGTPISIGTYSFLVHAMDAQGQIARRAYTMSVLDQFLITTASLPDGTETESYTATLTSNSAAPSGVTWSLAAGTLPPGLTLAATGVISGTTALHGPYSFTVRAVNGRGQQAAKTLSILVVESLVMVTQNLGEAIQGRPYTWVLTAAGGRAPYVWSLAGTSLPAGLSLNPSTGVISGTTSMTEGGYPQNVVVTDSRGRMVRKTLPLLISIPPPPSLSISPVSLPNGRVGQAYSALFTASGGTPAYLFNLAQGAMPAGLVLAAGGSLSGTPAQEGTYRFTVNVTDSTGRVAGNFYVVVIEPALLPLMVTPAAIAPAAPLGQPLSLQFGATGGKAPYTFAFTGNTPPGTNSNSAGLLSGTPSQGGTFTFTVEVTDSLQAKANQSYSITVSGNLMITTQPPLPQGIVGKSYSLTFGAAGGRAPYTWSLTGTAPPGLAFDGAAGTLAGMPSAAGTYPFSLTVQDSQRLTATASFSITINDPLEITNAPGTAPLIAGRAFSFTFTTRGGTAPVSFALNGGGLPAGLSMNAAGVISGTPAAPGTYTFAVLATDALGGTAARTVTLSVVAGLTVTTGSLPSGTVGAAYSARLESTGGEEPLGSWTVFQDALPAGLTLSPEGVIAGTPTAAGTTSFTVRIEDATGAGAVRMLTITIALPPVPPLVISGLPQALPPGTQTDITISLAQPFPVTVTGTFTLVFEPNAVNNADDPSVQFSSGGRTVTFTIPAGETSGVFPVTPLRLLSGTVAGTIRIRTTTDPASSTPVPDATVPIARSVPVITAGTAQLGTGTFTLLIDGFSNTREISSATVRLTPSPGAPLVTTDIPVTVAPAFTTWYQSSAAAPFGGQFRLSLPFTVTGSLADIESVTVTVSNAVGASQPFTVRLR